VEDAKQRGVFALQTPKVSAEKVHRDIAKQDDATATIPTATRTATASPGKQLWQGCRDV
jgi:hypothetical protein